MIRYNDDNIYVGYIKQLLHSFNLPCCKVDRPHTKYYVGEYFINENKNAIYKVKSVDENYEKLEVEHVCDYKFGDKVLNITKNLEIRNNFYDSYTHEYLGEYLRFIRDFKDIDLMSLYNCFSNNSVRSMNFEFKDENKNLDVSFKTSDSAYTIYAVPVKPNTTYTIAVDYHSKIEMFCGFYAYYKQIIEHLVNGDEHIDMEKSSYKNFSSLVFTSPIIYTTPDISRDMLNQEKNMKLFIKLPSSYSRQVVVLEGDYRKSSDTQLTEFTKILAQEFFNYSNLAPDVINNSWYFNNTDTQISSDYELTDISYTDNKSELGLGDVYTVEQFNSVKNKLYRIYTLTFSLNEDTQEYVSGKIYFKDIVKGNYDYTTRNELLRVASSTRYLLATRLVEYLSRNAITPDDEIINNIKKVQLLLAGNRQDKLSFDAYGKWSEGIREWIYRYLNTHKDSRGIKYIDLHYDLLCYVDKDIESLFSTLDTTEKARQLIKELGGDDYAI